MEMCVGMSREDFIAVWNKEATTALSMRDTATRKMELFKVVADNTVRTFIGTLLSTQLN